MLILPSLCNIKSAIQIKYYQMNIGPGRSVKGSRWEGSRMRTPGGSRLEKMATPGTRLKFLWTYVKIGNDVDSNVTMCVELNEQNKNRSPAPWWSLISFDEHCDMPRDQLSKSRPRVIGHLPYCDQFDPGLLLPLREHWVTVVNLKDKH